MSPSIPSRCFFACAGLLLALAVARPASAVPIQLFSPARIQELTRSSAATRADCLAAVAALVLGRAAPADDKALVKVLADREIVRESDVANLRATATRGYACLLFKRALGDTSGLLTTLVPNSEHYAYQHLQYLGLIPAGSSWVSITGPELIALVSLSKRYQHDGRPAGAKETR